MSETQPFTLWSELAQTESFSNTWPQETGGVGGGVRFSLTRGRSVETLSHGAFLVRKSGCYKRGRQHQSSPEETKDSETSEKGTERDVVGCQAQEKCPFQIRLIACPGPSTAVTSLLSALSPTPTHPNTLPSICSLPLLAWRAGWGTGGGKQRIRASW